MFGEGFDVNALLAQAQAMQAQFEQAQQALAKRTVTGSAGGDAVVVTMNGLGELLTVTIKPEVCDPSDTETLGDLVVAAVRDANHQAQAIAGAAMPAMPDLKGLDG